jgi:hypothetical protein
MTPLLHLPHQKVLDVATGLEAVILLSVEEEVVVRLAPSNLVSTPALHKTANLPLQAPLPSTVPMASTFLSTARIQATNVHAHSLNIS